MTKLRAALIATVLLCVAAAGVAARSDFLQSVAAGRYHHHNLERIFASNSDIGTAEELVWESGGAHSFPMAPGVVVIEHSGYDVAAGSGARSVVVECLDPDWDEAVEIVVLGAGPTTSTVMNCVRSNRGWALTGGTYAQTYVSPFGSNAGVISASIGGDAQWTIPAGHGESRSPVYTVPRGFTAYLVGIQSAIETAKSVEFFFYQRRNANDTTAPCATRRLVYSVPAQDGRVFRRPLLFTEDFPEFTDLWVTAKGPADTARVSFEYLLYVEAND